MNLDHARLALLRSPSTALWTGTVSAYTPATYALTVITATGAFPTDIANLLLVREGLELTRVRARDASTLTLAETPVEFTAGDSVALYNARLPWPRYQRIAEGVVYKDFDVAFPATWQAALPPTPVLRARVGTNDWQEAIYCQTGDTLSLDASASLANLDDGAPLEFTWDAGAGGTLTGSGATVTAEYSTDGFRYLTVTVTDAHGSAVTRYLPVWVGNTLTVEHVTRCTGRWDTRNGWTVDLEIAATATILQYGPAAVVDIETQEVIFFGFIIPNAQTVTFERTTTTLTLQSALTFSRYLHAYPFLVTEVTGVTVPDNWAELYAPTLARALWFLLYWHSTLPEVVNIDLGSAPARSIAGQEFTLGSLPQQMDAILKSAFWQARGNRAGGFTVAPNPLYLDAATWAALPACNLSAGTALRDRITRTYAEPVVNQVRLGGVFQDAGGTFEPALAQAPTAPGPWGSPAEVNNLAPVSATELATWAGRYIAIANTADEYSIQPGLPVDPAAYRVADLPDSVRIAIERVELDVDPAGLYWRAGLSGRSYGRSVAAVALPIPPAVQPPTPVPPPALPPVWPAIPPEPSPYADGDVVVAGVTLLGGGVRVAFTTNFLDEADTHWTNITGNLGTALDSLYQVKFAQGGTHRYSIYALGISSGAMQLWWLDDPVNETTWVQLPMPTDIDLSNTSAQASTTIAASPDLDGVMLIRGRLVGNNYHSYYTTITDGVVGGAHWCGIRVISTDLVGAEWGHTGANILTMTRIRAPSNAIRPHPCLLPSDAHYTDSTWSAFRDGAYAAGNTLGSTEPSGSANWPSWTGIDGNAILDLDNRILLSHNRFADTVKVGHVDAESPGVTLNVVTYATEGQAWAAFTHNHQYAPGACAFVIQAISTANRQVIFTQNSFTAYHTLTLPYATSYTLIPAVGLFPGGVEADNPRDAFVVVLAGAYGDVATSLVIARYDTGAGAWVEHTGDIAAIGNLNLSGNPAHDIATIDVYYGRVD
jgi:hypothetical protein